MTDPASVIKHVLQHGLSYLGQRALQDLADVALQIERDGLEGAWIEAGCALGGSAAVIAACKSPERPFYIFDTFGLIPPPSPRDDEREHQRFLEIASGKSTGISGTYYGYRPQLQADVTRLFEQLGIMAGVKLIPGLYEQTIASQTSVALAHIDCDWHDSVQICLQRIAPALVIGGRMVIDDYRSWSGCKRAVDDYFRDRGGYAFQNRARLHVIRNR